jgi:hypothetical protein
MVWRKMLGIMLSVVLVVGLWAAPAVLAQEKTAEGRRPACGAGW